MLLSLLQCSAFLFSALVVASKCSENNGFDHTITAVPAVEDMQPTNSWRFFRFTTAGSPALTRYEFLAPKPFQVSITDLYCTGDVFTGLNNGILLGQTPIPEGEPTCLNITLDPEVALKSTAYSSISGTLPSGLYNITIVPVISPWNAGSAAVRFRPLLDD